MARHILSSAGTGGGLIVQVGCRGGGLLTALGANDEYLVQGLDVDAEDVQKARCRIRSSGKSARVFAGEWNGERLPFVQNLVDVLVWLKPGDVHMKEAMRVLRPGGALYVVEDGQMVRRVKERPGGMDVWTHYLHGAGGNAVSTDRVVSPPKHYQWTAPPAWSRHHDTVLTTSTMVSTADRFFAIVDRNPTSEFHPRARPRWYLVARNAFNGLKLWTIPLSNWGWQAWGRTFRRRFAQPVQLPKRLVASGDRVYTTLDYHGPVSKVDAETGRVLDTFEQTRCADEIVLHRGLLVVSVYHPEQDPSLKYVCAVDADTGHLQWQRGPYRGLPARYDEVEAEDPVYLTTHGDRVAFASKEHLQCLELATGHERWRVSRPEHGRHRMNLGVVMSQNCSIVNHDGVVLFTQPHGQLPHTSHTIPCDLYAFSAASGRRLWKRRIGGWAWGHQADVFVIGGQTWVHNHIETKMVGPNPVDRESLDYAMLGSNTLTGEIEQRIPTGDVFHIGHHHRCYRNKATVKYVLTARRGVEFIGVDSRDITLHPWIRGECRLGIMPANGLLYTPPHPCQCYPSTLLNGFNAFAGSRKREEPTVGRRLQKGPACGETLRTSDSSSTNWPTYRHDAARTGCVPVKLQPEQEVSWTAQLRPPLTAVTLSGGRLYVGEKNHHAVAALDAEGGELLWRFGVGGPVDSPPTVAGNRVVFGCRDGWLYCLNAADGRLAWRFRAEAADLTMMDDGRLESVWPVHGSVLVSDGEVIAAAGRTSYLDGGFRVYRLDIETGRVLERRRISDMSLTAPDVLRDKDGLYDRYHVEGMKSDLLVARGGSVYMKTERVMSLGKDEQEGPLLLSHGGFLDDSLFERAFWYLRRADDTRIMGGQLLAYDETCAFGFRAYPRASRGGSYHTVGSGYTLCRDSFEDEGGKEKGGRAGVERMPFQPRLKRDFAWSRNISVRARSLVLTGNVVLVAGTPDLANAGSGPLAGVKGELDGRLNLYSRADGRKLESYDLPAAPGWGGMAVTDAGIHIVLQDGRIMCFRP